MDQDYSKITDYLAEYEALRKARRRRVRLCEPLTQACPSNCIVAWSPCDRYLGVKGAYGDSFVLEVAKDGYMTYPNMGIWLPDPNLQPVSWSSPRSREVFLGWRPSTDPDECYETHGEDFSVTYQEVLNPVAGGGVGLVWNPSFTLALAYREEDYHVYEIESGFEFGFLPKSISIPHSRDDLCRGLRILGAGFIGERELLLKMDVGSEEVVETVWESFPLEPKESVPFELRLSYEYKCYEFGGRREQPRPSSSDGDEDRVIRWIGEDGSVTYLNPEWTHKLVAAIHPPTRSLTEFVPPTSLRMGKYLVQLESFGIERIFAISFSRAGDLAVIDQTRETGEDRLHIIPAGELPSK